MGPGLGALLADRVPPSSSLWGRDCWAEFHQGQLLSKPSLRAAEREENKAQFFGGGDVGGQFLHRVARASCISEFLV